MSDLNAGQPITEDRGIHAGQIAFVASPAPIAIEAREKLITLYGECPLSEATVVVALGGDGFMLETIHQVLPLNLPVYGMNRGSVGFLMNTYSEDDLRRACLSPARRQRNCIRCVCTPSLRPGQWRKRWRSTKSACCASSAWRRRSAFRLMAACAWKNCPATAS